MRQLDFCHSPDNFRAYSRAYPRSLPLTPAHADAQISTGEWQKPAVAYFPTQNFFENRKS